MSNLLLLCFRTRHLAAVLNILMSFFVLQSATVIYGQEPISVDQLRQGFSHYNKEVVTLRGWVATEKRVESRSFKGYYLRDRFGAPLLIRTANPLPDITSEIKVTGVAMQDADTSDIYVAETTREIIPSQDKRALEKERAAAEQRERDRQAAEAAAQKQREEEEAARMRTLYLIGGAILGLIALAVYLTMRRRRETVGPIPATTTTQPSVATSPTPTLKSFPLDASSAGVDDFKTVRVYKTTRVLPGRFVVIEDRQETDIIHLSDQTGRGEIEIGRDSPDVSGGIRIKDKTNTLSRRQARVLYTAETKEFRFVNLAGAGSNPTVINSREMSENETVTLKDGDTLTMGNIELKFRQK